VTIRFHGVRALRHRNYRLFFTGQLISLIGTWMQQVAQAWLVLQLTNDPLWLGIVATAQFGPVIVLGLFGGVIADHFPKRRILLVTQTVSMVLAFVLFGLTATGIVEVWHVMVLAALLGIANAIDMPARQAFAAEMVGRDDIPNAVGLNAAVFNASRVVGPAVAGLLIGAFDISIAFLINAVSYIAVIAAYLLMRTGELQPVPATVRPTSIGAVFENLAEGARYVRRTPLVLLAVMVVGLGATFGMNFQILIPPLADDILQVGASGFGFLMAASGIGSLIAALSVAFTRRIGPTPIVAGTFALGFGTVVLALSTSYVVSLVAMFVAGLGAIAMAVTGNTTIQLTVPDHLRGRVMSVYTTMFAASVPVGGLLMGWIASSWSVPIALMVGALLTLATGTWAWIQLSRIRAAERRARPLPESVAAAAAGESLPMARRR
jgi:MFS family permease